jgi:hypothetical protein
METSNLAKVIFQFVDDLLVSFNLLVWRKRMDTTKLGPCKWDHATRAIKLHRAAAKRDHCMHKTEVLARKVEYVPEHLSLAVVFVENGVREELGLAHELLRECRFLGSGQIGEIGLRLRGGNVEGAYEGYEVPLAYGLVESDTNGILVYSSKVKALQRSSGMHDFSIRAVL